MISYGRWQREYGGRPDVLGKKSDFDLDTYTIVRVTPPGLAVPMSPNPAPEIWIPMSLDGVSRGSANVPEVFGLLRRGASSDAASRELQAIAASLPEKGAQAPARERHARSGLPRHARDAIHPATLRRRRRTPSHRVRQRGEPATRARCRQATRAPRARCARCGTLETRAPDAHR